MAAWVKTYSKDWIRKQREEEEEEEEAVIPPMKRPREMGCGHCYENKKEKYKYN